MEKDFRTPLVDAADIKNKLLFREIYDLRDRVGQLERKMIRQELAESLKSLDFWMKFLIGGIFGIAVILVVNLILRIIGLY